LKIEKGAGVFLPRLATHDTQHTGTNYPRHIAYRYNHKSYVIRLKTDNWQFAAQLIAEN